MCECPWHIFYRLFVLFFLYLSRSIVHYDGVAWVCAQQQLAHSVHYSIEYWDCNFPIRKKNRYEYGVSNLAQRKLLPLFFFLSLSLLNKPTTFYCFIETLCSLQLQLDVLFLLIVVWTAFADNNHVHIRRLFWSVRLLQTAEVIVIYFVLVSYQNWDFSFAHKSIRYRISSLQKRANERYTIESIVWGFFSAETPWKINLIIKLMAKCHTVIVLNEAQAHIMIMLIWYFFLMSVYNVQCTLYAQCALYTL